MECKVLLTDGEGTVFKSAGNLTVLDDGFELEYTLDGDKCVITCNGQKITQCRKGALNTEIAFLQGKETLCSISDGKLHGSIPVYTNSAVYICGSCGIKVDLDYLLDGERKNLSLTAVKIQKNKGGAIN